MHHAFLHISLPSLHDFEVKVLNFTFCGGRKHKGTLLFFSWTSIRQKIANISRTERDGTEARWSQREFTFYIERFHMTSRQPNWCSKTMERAAMLVYQDNPVGVDLFSYVKTFFCSNKLAYMLATLVKTLFKWRFCSRRRFCCLTVTWSGHATETLPLTKKHSPK